MYVESYQRVIIPACIGRCVELVGVVQGDEREGRFVGNEHRTYSDAGGFGGKNVEAKRVN